MLLIASTKTGDEWMLFAESILPWLTVFALCWKVIDKVFEYLGKRMREVIMDVVKAYMVPIVDTFEQRFDLIKKEHSDIKKMLEDIKKKQ